MRPTSDGHEHHTGDDRLVVLAGRRAARSRAARPGAPTNTAGISPSTSVASGSAGVPVTTQRDRPDRREPDEARGQRVAHLHRASRRGRAGAGASAARWSRSRWSARRRRTRRARPGRARWPTRRAASVPRTPAVTAICSATAGSARSTATPHERARQRAHEHRDRRVPIGRGRRPSVVSVSRLTSSPSTSSRPDGGLGLDRGEHQRRGDQREPEAGRRPAAARRGRRRRTRRRPARTY